jgi:ribosomal-protein-alanine N-acetyltransferase
MEAGDIDEVLEIEQASFPKPWTRGMFEGELRNPVSFSYTLKVRPEEGKVELGGYVVLWVVHGEAHILNIAVNPKYRGKGIASRLLSLMLELMKRNLVYEVFLEVRVSNTVARDLYKRFGFREAFIRKNYYGDEDAIVMVLDL